MTELTEREIALVNALGMLIRSGIEIYHTQASAISLNERRMILDIEPRLYLEFGEALRLATKTLQEIQQ